MTLLIKWLATAFGPWIIIGSLLGSASVGGLIVHKWHQASDASKYRAEQEKLNEERVRANELARTLELDLAKERAKRANAERELREELKNPTYTDCNVPPNGVQLLKDAVGTTAR